MNTTYTRLLVQNVKLKSPVIYAFNYPLTYYSAYGYKRMEYLKQTLIGSDDPASTILMPNLVNNSSSIETRSAKFMGLFKKQIDLHPGKKFHIVAHSFAGFDIRAMIHFYDLQEYVASVSTISTPHNGLTLLDNIYHSQESRKGLSFTTNLWNL